MAIFHLSLSNVSRAKGGCSCASLAYISGERIFDERTGQAFSYSRKERVVETGTILPDGTPKEYADPAVLFNSIEAHETAGNARTAKKVEIALPHELTLEQQKELVEKYIETNLSASGYAASYAIHTDKGGKNPHCHILVPNRKIEKDGTWAPTKYTKVLARDENGNKIPLIDPKTGKQKTRTRKGKGTEKLWKRIDVEKNDLDKVEFLQDLRASWADHANAALRDAGYDVRIDHRSNRVRGLAALPTIHEGAAAREMEKRGEISDRCEENRKIKAYNAAYIKERTSLLLRIAALDASLKQEQQRPQIQPTSPTLAQGKVQPRQMQPQTQAQKEQSAADAGEQRKRQKKFLRYCVARKLLAHTRKGGKVSPEVRKAVRERYGEAMAALGMDPKKVMDHAATEIKMRRSGAWTRPHTPGWPDVLSRIPPKLKESDPLPPHLPPDALRAVESRGGGAMGGMDEMQKDEAALAQLARQI